MEVGQEVGKAGKSMKHVWNHTNGLKRINMFEKIIKNSKSILNIEGIKLTFGRMVAF